MLFGPSGTGESRCRIPRGRHLQGDLRTRKGTMIGITEPWMATGKAVDSRRFATDTERVRARVRHASTVTAHDADGETFTGPASADGILWASLIGNRFAPSYGLLDAPMRLTVEGGWLVAVERPVAGLPEAFERNLGGAPNGRRVGDVDLGTDVGISHPTRNLVRDGKHIGMH